MTLENSLSSERCRKLHCYSHYDKIRSEKDTHFHMPMKNVSLFLCDYKDMTPNLWLGDMTTVL